MAILRSPDSAANKSNQISTITADTAIQHSKSERSWRAGVTGNGRGLTGVSPRPVHWVVSDSYRQIPANSG